MKIIMSLELVVWFSNCRASPTHGSHSSFVCLTLSCLQICFSLLSHHHPQPLHSLHHQQMVFVFTSLDYSLSRSVRLFSLSACLSFLSWIVGLLVCWPVCPRIYLNSFFKSLNVIVILFKSLCLFQCIDFLPSCVCIYYLHIPT